MKKSEFDNLSINELRDVCYKMSKSKGWHDPEVDVSFPTRIALIHSEVSEALEEYRNGFGYNETYFSVSSPTKPEGIPSELADIVIRVMDLAGKNGIDIQKAIFEKMTYNETRPHRHGGKVC